jgi:hypothetical protein
LNNLSALTLKCVPRDNITLIFIYIDDMPKRTINIWLV